ncbi:MAG: hypothetical protein AABZ60_06155 [Planctomycetota bacterium]
MYLWFVIFSFFVSFLWAEETILYSFEDPSFRTSVRLTNALMSQDQEIFKEGKTSLKLKVLEHEGGISFKLTENDWREYHLFSFWLYCEEKSSPKVTLELIGFEKRGGFKTSLKALVPGWQKIEIPLEYWSWKSWGSFQRIQHLKISCNQPCQIGIDQICLQRGAQGKRSYTLTFEERLALGFPENFQGVKAFYTENFCLLTQMDMDGDFFVEHCQSALRDFMQLIPLPYSPQAIPTIYLYVYPTIEAQQIFWDQLSAKMGKSLTPINMPSFYFQSFMTLTYKPDTEFMMPYFYQSIQQYLMTNLLGLFPKTSWATSGVLTYLLNFRDPPENLSTEVLSFFTNPDLFVRIPKFLEESEFKTETQLQAFTFIHFMAQGPHKEKFLEFLKFIKYKKDFALFFKEALKVKPEELERQYITFLVLYWSKKYTKH